VGGVEVLQALAKIPIRRAKESKRAALFVIAINISLSVNNDTVYR
jgi:hypothetical protein